MTDQTDESRFLQFEPSEEQEGAEKIGYFPEDILTQYKYNSSPRGCALIISNEDFPASSSYRPRLGDEADVENLTELCEMFGLEVSVLKNVTKEEMLDSLAKFREKFLEREVDLSFVCILSHGSSTNTIVDINGQDVQVEEEIIKEFDNKRCPQLIGKPKVFLLQYCRVAEETLVPMDTRGLRSKTRTPPPVSDVLLINSTIPGYVSLRNTVRGSWAVQCLVKVFKNYADGKLDIRDLLDLVSIEVSNMETSDGALRQTIEIINRGFFKKFYISPIANKMEQNSSGKNIRPNSRIERVWDKISRVLS